MRSLSRHGVWIALAGIGVSIALVVWWASAHSVTSDARVDGDSVSRSDASDLARAELETSEVGGARTTAAPRAPEVVATSEFTAEATRPGGQIRLRLVDAQGQRLTRLKGFLGIERDPPPRVSNGWHGGIAAPSTDPVTRNAWNVTIPESGEYVFEGLELGKWNVDCQADGFHPASVDVILLEANPRQEIELVVSRQRTIEVSFRTPDGEPFRAALNSAYPRYADAVRLELTRASYRGASGLVGFKADIGPARDALYWLTLRANTVEDLTVSAFISDTLLARVAAPVGVENVTLVASVDAVEAALGTLTVVVVDQATDRPIAGASVQYSLAGFALPPLIADEDGRAVFGRVVGPKVSVSAVSDGYAKATQRVVVTPGARAETIVRLDHGVTISGEVRTGDRMFMEAVVNLAAFDEGSSRGAFVSQTRSHRQKFTFEHLPRGHYVVFTHAARRNAGANFNYRYELAEPPEVAALHGRLPRGLVYVDTRGGDVSDVVLDVPDEEFK